MILEDIQMVEKYKNFIEEEGDTTDDFYKTEILKTENNLDIKIKEHHISLDRQKAALELFILIIILNIIYIKFKKTKSAISD